MTLRRRKRILATATALILLATAGMVAGGLGWPPDVEPGQADPTPAGPPRVVSVSVSVPGADAHAARELAELRQLCSVKLRRPLYDPPAEAVAAPAAVVMSLRLVGTVNEPGHSMAMFRKPDGSIELCGPGARLADAAGPVTVIRIEGQRVTVRFAGAERELVLATTP